MTETVITGKSMTRKQITENIIAIVVFALGLLMPIVYIWTKARVDYNVDFSDTLLWAAASFDGGSLINHDFWYAYTIPFSGYLLMIPLVKIFGVTYLTHELGMTLFVIIFVVAAVFAMKAIGQTNTQSLITVGIMMLLISSSHTTRMIFFGHVIHYSMAMLFTFVALILLKKLDCLRKWSFAYVILLVWTLLAGTNGPSSLMLYVIPLAGALILERLLDKEAITWQNIKLLAFRIAGFLAAAAAGYGIKHFRVDRFIDTGYETKFSSFLAAEEWMWTDQPFTTRFATLLTDWVYGGVPMLSQEGIFIMIRFVMALTLLIIPGVALFFYKKCENRMMRILLLDYWVLFILTQITYSTTQIQEANWRLASLLDMSIIVSLVWLLWILKDEFFGRFAWLILCVFAATAVINAYTVITLPTDPTINGYDRLAKVLDENDLHYGYTELWGGANAITVMTDSRIKVCPISFEDGSYRIEPYQSQPSWYDDQQDTDRYFIMISDEIVDDYRDTLVKNAVQKITFEENTILVFDRNPFADGQPVFAAVKTDNQ